ncbi:16S rRNA (cytidine(1402)-2'-O)-methyltransferase [Devosia sp.]|uniref:16S rRNA (cytidine(1402)-2'-O)-methyltransferase n=1 Tax=Devosia sp. TaxID=1871048 RepID=UPI0035B336C3
MTDRARHFFIAGTAFPAAELAAGLYVVSTPIGNLKDISLRALETLAGADLVLCEDTRHSATLLDHYGIRTRRQALHEHNERARADEIAAMIADGRAVAQISDAGTPLLSDPGFPLVRAVREAGLPVIAIPGASALLAGLASAGLPTDAFSFVGFLPAKAGARANALAALAGRSETLVFYESPRRLGEALAAMAEILGVDRPAAVGLELTKRFERFERGSLGELAARFAADETRGEAVVLVGGARNGAPVAGDWEAALAQALATEPLRGAVDMVTARFGLKRKEVYERALALRTEP